MKKKRIMRILSALLCTVMDVGMIPAGPVTVNAEGQTDAVATGTTNTVSVDTWEELAAALVGRFLHLLLTVEITV